MRLPLQRQRQRQDGIHQSFAPFTMSVFSVEIFKPNIFVFGGQNTIHSPLTSIELIWVSWGT